MSADRLASAASFVPTAPAIASTGSSVAAYSALPAAAFRCVEQPVSATVNGRAEPQCYGPSTSSQSGSVVSYRFAGRGETGARWLVADVAGGNVVAVSAGRGAQAEFACAGEACSGLSIGAADLYGVRQLRLAHLALSPTGSAGTGLLLDGTLSTTADSAADAPACAGQTVLVSGDAGRTTRFCPGDGIAVSRNDDGGWTYRFTSAEAMALVVELDGGFGLRRVEHGAMECASPSCTGVDITASAPRTIRFNGTLIQGGGTVSAWESLSGSLLLPSW